MTMQLRSGRRLASPVPAPRGDLRRVRPRRSQDGDDDNGKDRISSLPKEMRLEVLACLQSTREAMRTSVLSEPWRGLWTELRELTFDDITDLDLLLSALAQVQPKLNRLCIEMASELGGASISSLLLAADKLEPLELVVRLCRDHRSAPFVLPCFARATSIELRISCLLFELPPTGSFASLEQLTMLGASFIYPGVLLPRCPRLRKLTMDGKCPRGVTALAVESSRLVELVWHLLDVEQPVDIHVVAPNLKSFVFSSLSRKFTMSLSAPKLEVSSLCCKYYLLEDFTVGCVENVRWRLYLLRLDMGPGMGMMEWSDRDSRRKHVLSLDIDNVMVNQPVERSFEQQVVARLPVTLTHFSALELSLRSDGHVFGSLVLQLLRIRTNIHRLKVTLLQGTECWEHCDCDFASNWRNELISLPRLEVAEFEDFRGDDHELDFLKLLFGSAPSLKTVRVHHFNEVSIVKAACQKLQNMFSANASVSFLVHQFLGSSSAIATSVVNLCLSG